MGDELSKQQVKAGQVIARDLEELQEKVDQISADLLSGREITPAEVAEFRAELSFAEEAMHAIMLTRNLDPWECGLIVSELPPEYEHEN